MKHLSDSLPLDIPPDSSRPRVSTLLMRGVARGLTEQGFVTLPEFKLNSGRRADIMALGQKGEILIVEVKSSLEDYRSDHKWRDYLDYCDRFYFAVTAHFPRNQLPEDCGLLIADGYGAVVLRDAPYRRLNAARRRSESLRFARAAAERLSRLTDPR